VLGQDRKVEPMSISEPATQLVTEHTEPDTLLPRQRAAAEPMSAPADQVAVDHVRRHGRACYWDVAECRWRCS
jgi:hypothetical protein